MNDAGDFNRTVSHEFSFHNFGDFAELHGNSHAFEIFADICDLPTLYHGRKQGKNRDNASRNSIGTIDMTATDPLLQPFQLKHLTFKNRVMSTSHASRYVVDGKPQERYQRYHEEKAKGGLALTMFGGSSIVGADSPSLFNQIYVTDDSIIPYFQAFADRVHAHGAALMCQLTHMGRRTRWSTGHWLPTLAPTGEREAM